MTDDLLDAIAETTTYAGRASWSKKVIDAEVGDLSDDQRLGAALRSASGIFMGAGMPYTASLLRVAARSLDPPDWLTNG